MASSASVAVLTAPPFPTCPSSDDSDDAKPLPPPPASGETRPPPQHQQRPRWWQLERDCNVAMKALARAGEVDQVLALFTELRASRTGPGGAWPPSVLCYNTLVNALAQAGRVEEAHDAFDEMLAAGVAPNASSLNILVKLHSWRSARFDLAYEVIIRLQELGVEADVGTYSTLVTGLCRVGRVGEAWGVLEWMLEVGCRPMVQTYTPIVQGYCREGRVDEAKELMSTMENTGCPPNVVTYNVLIRALCDAARFDEVRQVLMDSRTKDWKPSTVTYNTFMNGLCKKGMAKEALEQLDVMLGEGLDPTDFTLSILLNCLCHDKRIHDAVCLLERSTSLKCYAGVVAYNTVMSRLGEMGHWMGVLKLLTDMIKRGVMPNTRTFNIVIRSLCFRRKFSIAKSLASNQGFAANVVTYNTLIYFVFYYSRKLSEVKDLIFDMTAERIAPDEVTYTIIVDGLCRDGFFDTATSYFLESLEIGLSRDLFAVLTNRLAHNGKIWETIHIFKGMEEKGLIPDNSIFDLTIRIFCRAGYCHDTDMFKLNFILDTMLGKQ
ncbi:hypothetical protein CFC21_006059 [Triticum aestivum]|uniref:Pentacotripeptide-repeat region of PRORP domain-containing protein n=2 Tax=Triticum aestivum TaxID=4565 RepID=A0A3B5YU54_WHEAT|nr:pentatricopeptide repeat-containing protein At1g09900-like [Triticum aestivum]KAF6988540.1 hypothetical protein CFC21_006059 [Triticum aestivum]